MGSYRTVGEELVAAASPRFKDFRVDFEKISNAASKSGRGHFFFDSDWDLRIPLQHRYASEKAFEPIWRYHVTRFKLSFGRDTPWPDEPANDALQLFASHGRADLGVQLIRTCVEIHHKRLKRYYSKRNPRGPRGPIDQEAKVVIGAINKVMAESIPDGKRSLLSKLEAVAPYIEAHGTAEDRAWLEALHREIWMEKRA
ncbi:MAG TPA: hypothetical protein VGD23_05880 [Sphingomicrobium sp.]